MSASVEMSEQRLYYLQVTRPLVKDRPRRVPEDAVAVHGLAARVGVGRKREPDDEFVAGVGPGDS